jgi:hypothetical protein
VPAELTDSCSPETTSSVLLSRVHNIKPSELSQAQKPQNLPSLPKPLNNNRPDQNQSHQTNITMSDTETSAFTANETKLICAVMQNLTSDIQVAHP